MPGPHLSAEAWAAWAQAIGTVVAIAVTQRISTRQDRARRAERQREEDKFLDVILFVTNEALRSVNYSMTHLKPGKRQITPEAFQRLIAALVRLPIERMPSGELASLLIKLERLLSYFARRHESAIDALEEEGAVSEAAQVSLDRFAAQIRKRCNEIKRAIARLKEAR
jgi:hypothetical protein